MRISWKLWALSPEKCSEYTYTHNTQYALLYPDLGVQRPPVQFHRPQKRKGKENVYQKTRIELSIQLSMEFVFHLCCQRYKFNGLYTSQFLIEEHIVGFRRYILGGICQVNKSLINYYMNNVFNGSFAKVQNYFSHGHFYIVPWINPEDILTKEQFLWAVTPT